MFFVHETALVRVLAPGAPPSLMRSHGSFAVTRARLLSGQALVAERNRWLARKPNASRLRYSRSVYSVQTSHP